MRYIPPERLYRHIKNINDYRLHNGELYQRVDRKMLELRLLNQDWPIGVQPSTVMTRSLAALVLQRAPVLEVEVHEGGLHE